MVEALGDSLRVRATNAITTTVHYYENLTP